MGVYLDMWTEVKKLTTEQQKEWLDNISPVKGNFLDFRGVNVIDIDLAEALDYMINHR